MLSLKENILLFFIDQNLPVRTSSRLGVVFFFFVITDLTVSRVSLFAHTFWTITAHHTFRILVTIVTRIVVLKRKINLYKIILFKSNDIGRDSSKKTPRLISGFERYRRKRPKVDASIFDSALSHTRRSAASEEKRRK